MLLAPTTTPPLPITTHPQVWDVRRLADTASGRKPSAACCLSELHHTKSSQGAVWAPDGTGRLLSVSFDDTLKIWGQPGAAAAAAVPTAAGFTGKGMQQLRSIKHDNNTGRWVIPFRPTWWGCGAVVVGDMKRGVAVFDAGTGSRVGLVATEALTAIPSRLAAWGAVEGGSEGSRPMLAAATSSGRVHVFR